MKETNLCTFCNETKESILHLFWECNYSKNVWLEFAETLKNKSDIEFPMSAQNIIMGADTVDLSLNYFIVLIKYFIYACRLSGSKPIFIGLINMLKQTYNVEKLSATFSKSPAVGEKIVTKWAVINDIFERK